MKLDNRLPGLRTKRMRKVCLPIWMSYYPTAIGSAPKYVEKKMYADRKMVEKEIGITELEIDLLGS